MVIVWRLGYRIDSRTIKGGSQVSSVIVSFVESSNHCILASYFLILICIFLLVRFGAFGHIHDKLEFIKNGVHMHLLWCFWCWRLCSFFSVGGLTPPFVRHTSPASSYYIQQAWVCSVLLLLVVLYPTSLSLLNSELICRSYGSFGFLAVVPRPERQCRLSPKR